ncbi:MAG: SDR family NAD(P)-dependent oxidoreductase [Deltaproteobacteria bacterium]|nr:SDR family NAD(P)-dependent oxidoreductase [Deltaproteobacteria bacterium]
MTLEGRVAIVTGASRGLGKEIAKGLSREGARVVIAARSEKDTSELPGTIYETAEEIKASGSDALAIRCDVTDEDSVTLMVNKAVEEFGRLDILVNNAGVAFYFPIVETPTKRWELVFRVNVLGAFLCAKAVLPHMIRQKRGSIVNISSLAADERDEGTVPTGVAYAASKAALDRLTWGLATEVGKYNIAVNAVKPHRVVDTEGMRLWQPGEDRSQWQSAEMMVKAVNLLAIQDGKGITGMVATDREVCAWHGLI